MRKQRTRFLIRECGGSMGSFQSETLTPMLKLCFLLIGSEAFRARWYAVAGLGLILIALAAGLALDAVDGATFVTQETLGLVFMLNGVLALMVFLQHGKRSARTLALLKAGGLLLVGTLILFLPPGTLATLFVLGFVLDGLGRIATAVVVRFDGWRTSVVFGVIELAAAGLIMTDWPLPHSRNIPFAISLLLALTGWLLLRLGLMFRTLESEATILALPLFGQRGWYDTAPILVDTGEPVRVEHPMTVHVWTPVGSAYAAERRLLVDRYIAAVDGHGVISTGHAALEMPPNLYISHYPAQEIERSSTDFMASLRGTPENDLKGRFQPSYAYETAEWCPADQHVVFENYNPRRLRAFWAGYRQDDTYNLCNRNCSVVVAHALDAALEGALASRFPWLKLLQLLVNPDIWVAAAIRSRAASMTWTPGLVLDYAATLARLVEHRETAWSERMAGFLRRWRSSPSDSHEARAA